MKTIRPVLFLLVILISRLSAQLLPVKLYTIRDGLLANGSTCLLQDSHGILWLGTGDGINTFDGTTFNKITLEDGLLSNSINCILESKSNPGVMWIGTRKGLHRIKVGIITPYQFPGTPHDNNIISLYEDNKGVIWCGTVAGIWQFSQGKANRFAEKSIKGYVANIDNNINKNALYINSEYGFYRINLLDNSIKKIDFGFNKPETTITSVHAREDGSLLAVSSHGNLYNITDKPYLIKKLIDAPLFSLLDGGENIYYVGSKKGLIKLKLANNKVISQTIYTKKNGLPADEIRMGLRDNEDNLWYATFSGLIKIPLKSYTRFEFKESAGRMIQDWDSHLWVSELHQLNEFWSDESGEWKRKIHPVQSALPGWIILNLAIDKNDRLWLTIGNSDNKSELHCYPIKRISGDNSFLGNRLYCLSPQNGFPSPTWFSLIIDSDNYLWCSTDPEGIAGININGRPKLITKLTTADGLIDPGARALFEDRNKNIWVGGWERGLAVFSKKKLPQVTIRNYTTKDGLPDNCIRSIAEDKYGRMIFGTRYGGLSVLDSNHFRNYSYRDGLPSSAVWYITQSDQNMLLLGTGSGIAISDIDSQLRFSWLKDFRGNQISIIGSGADGMVWFLDWTGLTIYPNRFSPQIRNDLNLTITSVRTNGIEQQHTQKIELESNENNVLIKYTTITFSNVDLTYEYKMDTGNKAWHKIGTQNYILFSALESGTYEVFIRGVDERGIPVTRTASVSFAIAPPYWRTWWFISLSFLIVIVTAAKSYNWSVAKLKKRQQLLLNLIEEKEHAEIELKKSQQLFTIINEGVSDLIAILTLDGKRLYSSKSYSGIFGETKLSGTDSFAEIHIDDRERIKEIFAETISSGKGKRTEYRFVLADGSIRHIESEGNLIRDVNGNPSNVIVVSRDISERKKYEEALLALNQSLENKVMERTQDLLETNERLQNEIVERELIEQSLKNSEEHYRLLVENANEAILVAQDGMITYANPKTFSVIDYTPDELLLKPFTEFIYHEDRPIVVENYIRRMRGEEVDNNYHFRIVHKDNSLRVVEINAVKIMWREKPATLNFLTDITERKRVDDEIRNALEKEKELSEIRSRFISMASHEFRTPLTSILTSAEIIQHFNSQLTDEVRTNNLSRIQDNVKHMTRILNDILFIGKWDAGKIILDTALVDLEKLCAEVIEQMNLFILNNKCSHKIIFTSQTLRKNVLLDQTLIRQILENLISNAIKYSPGKERVWFTASCDNETIQFTIRDEGIGIEESEIPRLYESFHRGKNVGNISGTGLGLVVVKRAVELHGGTLTVRSSHDAGTQFLVNLPLKIALIYE
ncbi:MAG: PAS domain S-box protein [Ignavibacteriales bacterium]|nr:PAS domain S-box protein [Ignavibacteriales bacterium]